MYKLLVVDDDEIICNGVASINWQPYGVEVVGTAFDGEIALELIEQTSPDILIVDISMPFMDGIELTDTVRKKHPHIKVIMLTAFKEFSYAQRAVELQVFHYLTKPFQTEELIQTVERVTETLDRETTLRRVAEKGLDLLNKNYLMELVNKGLTEENREFVLQILGPNSCNDIHLVAILYLKTILQGPDGSDRPLNEEAAVLMSVDTVSSILQDRSGIHFFAQNDKIVFLFSFPVWDEIRCRDNIRSVLGHVMEELSKNDLLFLSCGIGNPYQGLELICSSCCQAKQAVEHCSEFGNMSLIEIGEVSSSCTESIVDDEPYKEILQNAVQENDLKTLIGTLDDLFTELKTKHVSHMLRIQFMALELVITVYHAINDEALYRCFWRDCQKSYYRLLKTDSIDSIYSWMSERLESAYAVLRKRDVTPLEKLVNRATDFIESHYSDPDLTLKTVAEAVHISFSYLSALFRQYKGTSFVNYLASIRMANAVRLIADPNIKTYEVAYMVGFNSSQYFSSSFKKHTGMTPGEYRSRIQQKRSVKV